MNGEAVPGASATLTARGRQAGIVTIAGRDGAFSFGGVPAAVDRVWIESPGFETYLSGNIALGAGEKLQLPAIRMQISATHTTVNVVVTQKQGGWSK